jgi:ornithine--oxo-acid transaminase
VARAALRVLQDERLPARAEETGAYFLQLLKELRSPLIKEVRGRGLWLAIELRESARPYVEALMRAGVLCKETHDTVLRIAPPLTIERSDIDWAMQRIRRVFEQ